MHRTTAAALALGALALGAAALFLFVPTGPRAPTGEDPADREGATGVEEAAPQADSGDRPGPPGGGGGTSGAEPPEARDPRTRTAGTAGARGGAGAGRGATPEAAPGDPRPAEEEAGRGSSSSRPAPRRFRAPLAEGSILRGWTFRQVPGGKVAAPGVLLELHLPPLWRDLGNVLVSDPVPVTSGEDGRFEVRVPPGDAVVLRGVPADPRYAFPSHSREVEIRTSEEVLAKEQGFQVLLRGRASGVVLDAEGLPVEGAAVSAFRGEAPWLLLPGDGFEATVTGRDGKFLLPRLPAGGNFRAWASKPPLRKGLSGAFTVREDGEKAGLEVRLLPGAEVRGRVAFEDGAPAAGALVAILRGDVSTRGTWNPPPWLCADMPDPVRTDGDGGFVVRGVEAPAMVRVSVWGERIVPVEVAEPMVQVPEGGVEVPTVLVRRVHPLRGVVLDEEGRPVGEAVVSLVPGQPNTTMQVVTGADGRFETRVFAGTHRVHVWCPTHVADGSPEVEVPREGFVEVRVKGGFVLEGEAIGADGKPAGGVRVYAFDGKGAAGGAARADAGGRFHFRLGNPGPWRLGIGPASLGFRTTAPVLAPSDGIEMRASAGAPLAGVLKGPDGAPLAGVHVQALPSWGGRTAAAFLSRAEATTDGEGRFRMEGLVEDAYDLECHGNGFACERAGVRPGETDLVLRAEAAPAAGPFGR